MACRARRSSSIPLSRRTWPIPKSSTSIGPENVLLQAAVVVVVLVARRWFPLGAGAARLDARAPQQDEPLSLEPSSSTPVLTMARIKMIKPGETIGLQLDADQREAILALKLARPEIRDRIRQ